MTKFLGCELIHTTAYNPKANGFVERYYQALKASINAQSNPNEWYSNLGWILLGLRSAVRDNFEFSPAVMVFGTSLRFTVEYFLIPDHHVFFAEYVSQLQQFIKNSQPVPTRKITFCVTHVDSKLSTCSHAFVRNDGVKIGLQRPYNGPFRVSQRSDKYFQLNMNGPIDNVCIDRLKPANFLDAYDSKQQQINSSLPISDQNNAISKPRKNSAELSFVVSQKGRVIRKPRRYGL